MFASLSFPLCFAVALQDMLPTIMSQMGMSTDLSFGSEGGRRKGDQGQSGDGHPATIHEQVGAEADDDVPGKFDRLNPLLP